MFVCLTGPVHSNWLIEAFVVCVLIQWIMCECVPAAVMRVYTCKNDHTVPNILYASLSLTRAHLGYKTMQVHLPIVSMLACVKSHIKHAGAHTQPGRDASSHSIMSAAMLLS